MAIPAPAIPFYVRLADGRVWGGAEFPSGFVCVQRPGESTVATVAASLDELIANLPGATVVERY